MYKNPRCGHRKLHVRPVGEKYRASCAKCGKEGADHGGITEAYMTFRSDLVDAEAERAATKAAEARA
jgi:transcription elongation factor Elf1